MGFSRQEFWSEFPCPSPGDLPDPGLEPVSPVAPALQADSLPLSHLGSLGPITSWQIDIKKMETRTNFIFLGSKITVDFDCSHEIKRCLFLGRKVIRNLDSIFKNRDIISLTKVHTVKAITFSSSHVWM